MRRSSFILILGLLLAAFGYCSVYWIGTSAARSLEQSAQPELAWLKQQFNLSDPEFQRIAESHAAYLPRCREMCNQIDAHNQQLQNLFAGATNLTPEIEQALAESSRLRAECQTMMLHHFFKVSQLMPSEQGARYLGWMKQKAFLPDYGMDKQP